MILIYNNPIHKNKRRLLRRNQTDAEQKMWQMLRNRQMKGLKFFRQYGVGEYIIDFYCPDIRIAIEIDGGQHLNNESDIKRSEKLSQRNIIVIRFWNNDVLISSQSVCEKIELTIDKMNITPPNLPLS